MASATNPTAITRRMATAQSRSPRMRLLIPSSVKAPAIQTYHQANSRARRCFLSMEGLVRTTRLSRGRLDDGFNRVAPRLLPSARTGQGARMVECIFSEQTLAACLIEGDQARDQCTRRHGLGEGHRLLIDNAAGSRNATGMSGNRSCSTPRSSQRQRSTRFAPVKFAAKRPMRKSSSAVTVHWTPPPAGGAYSTDTQAFLRGTFQK